MFTKNTLIIVLVAIIAAFTIFTCNGKKPERPAVISTADQKKHVDSVKAKLIPVIDSLKIANKQLIKNDSVNRKSLAFYQSETRRLIKEAKEDANALYQPPGNADTDYISNKQIVEFLVMKIDLISASAKKSDSACNASISNLDSQILNLNKTLAIKDTLYNSLSNSFDTAMVQQDRLTAYTKKLEKKNKWGGIGKVAWKTAAILEAVLITALIILK